MVSRRNFFLTSLSRLTSGLFVPSAFAILRNLETDEAEAQPGPGMPFFGGGVSGPVSAPLASAISVQGNAVNGYSLTLGFRITPNKSITITDVGRWKIAGNSHVHTCGIYVYESGVALGTVSIDMSTGSAGTWVYATLASPVTVGPFTSVHWVCASVEVSGQDQLYDCNGGTDTTVIYNSTDTTIDGSVFSSGGAFGTAEGGNGKTFGPMNFKYHL